MITNSKETIEENTLKVEPWMSSKKLFLIETDSEFKDLVQEICTQNKYLYPSALSPRDKTLYRHCAVDLETTGLDVRVYNGVPRTRIVGLCLAYNDESAYYVPVGHDIGCNISWSVFLTGLQRILNETIAIFHHMKYDAEILSNWGFVVRNYPWVEDTQILCWLRDSNTKRTGLKIMAETLLGRKMVEIGELFSKKVGRKKVVITFNELSPVSAFIYGCCDALNTFGLFLFLIPVREAQSFIHKLEISIVPVVRKMERNRIRIDSDYLSHLDRNITRRLDEIQKEIFDVCGCEFNLDSPKIVGEIFFNRLKLPHYSREDEQKTPTGMWKTDAKTMEDLSDKFPQYKLFSLLVTYRQLSKSKGTYVANLRRGIDENGDMKVSFLSSHVPSGRFASSSDKEDNGATLNVQSIPANYELKFIKPKRILNNPVKAELLRRSLEKYKPEGINGFYSIQERLEEDDFSKVDF